MRPLEPCCNYMQDQLRLCADHGLACPELLVHPSPFPQHELVLWAPNSIFAFSFCPWCGTKIQELEEPAERLTHSKDTSVLGKIRLPEK